MKKSTLEMIHALLNDQTVDMDTLREEVNAEWERTVAKSKEKADAYAAAKPVIMAALKASKEPLTVKELYERCVTELPEDFGAPKIQYALRAYWADEVEKHENGKNPNAYSAKK